MQFVKEGVKLTIKYGPTLLKEAAKKSAPVVRQGVHMTKDYTRGVVTGTPKWRNLGDMGARETTITASLRAGMQTRRLAVDATRAVVIRGPMTAVKLTAGAARATAREALAPYQASIYLYQGLRAVRGARGATTLTERVLDRYVAVSSRFLNKYRLIPHEAGTIRGLAYYAVLGLGAREVSRGVENGLDIVKYGLETVKRNKADFDAVLDHHARPGTMGTVPDNPVIVVAPVADPPRRDAALPLQPPVQPANPPRVRPGAIIDRRGR